MLNKKKILIIGGTGFIGYNLACFLKKKNFKIFILSKNPPKKDRFIKGIRYFQFDITIKKNFRILKKFNFEYVVNLAGYVDHTNKNKTFRDHYLGVKNLANFFLEKDIKLFIQIGTGGEYGNLKSPHKEESKSCSFFSSNYFYAKYLSTKFLMRLSDTKNFPATVLRLYQTYGPKQDLNRFIPYVIKNCINNNEFKTSNGKQFRDFIFISDLVLIIYKCLQNYKVVKKKIFNVGYGKPINIKKIIYKIMRICNGRKPIFGKISLRKDENIITFPSIDKIRKTLFFKPRINFEKGVKITIKSFLS